METRIIRSMSRALEDANAGVQIVSSKEFCPEVAEPFYSPGDILQFLQDAKFRQRITDKRIQYIVLIALTGGRGGWTTHSRSEINAWAVYNKSETTHSATATIIDLENAEPAGILTETCYASSGYGFGVGFEKGFCCAFPFAWYGGETEDLAVRTLAASVAKFLTDKNALPDSKRPAEEPKETTVPPEPSPKSLEEEPTIAAVAHESKPEEVIERIKLREKAVPNFSDQDLQEMITERNFFNKQFNPAGNFPNAFVDNGDGTITDKVTGLMWQKAGSSSEMTFEAAGKYVQELNSSRFGGYDDWRLPTLEELCSLLEGTPNKSRKFMDNLSDPEQSLCWSADLNPHYKTAHSWPLQVAFYVNFIRGETAAGLADRFLPLSHIQQSRYHVKAVRTVE